MHPDRREPFIKLAGNRAAGPFLLMLVMVFSLFYSTGFYMCKQNHSQKSWKKLTHDDGSLCIVATLGINK